jgi:predicted membrane protein
MNFKKEIIFRIIKIFDIGYITALYLILGIILAKIFDNYLGKFDEEEEDKKPIWKIILEIILYSWVIGVTIYIVRNIVSMIPSPFDGIQGFNHLRVKELSTAFTFSITFMFYQDYYQKKIKSLYLKLSK